MDTIKIEIVNVTRRAFPQSMSSSHFMSNIRFHFFIHRVFGKNSHHPKVCALFLTQFRRYPVTITYL